MTQTAVLCAAVAALACATVFVAADASAQSQSSASAYPTKPVRLLIPFAPGGGADILNRIIAQRLTESMGQTVIGDNRPGADGVVATEIAARSPADGHTLLVVTLSFAINPAIGRKLPYEPLADFAPVTQTASQQIILVVHPSLPVKSVKELIEYAKSKPGGLNYGSSSNAGQLPAELFNSMAGLKMVHVPYKGSAPMLNDLVAGQIQLTFGGALATMPQVKNGKLRALAIGDSKRSALLPELPTIAESGLPGYQAQQWMGLVLPARTPQAIVQRLNKEVVRIVNTAEVRERLLQIGNEPVGSAPAQFGVFIKSEIAKWAKIAKEAGIKSES